MSTRWNPLSVLALTAFLSVTCSAQGAAPGGAGPAAGIDPSLMAKAEAGNREAEFVVGTKYELGAQVKKDPAQAAIWYRKAADKGDVRAEHSLGILYEFGNGVPANPEIAVAWYRKSAESGFAPAQFSLGLCYAHGKGVPQSYQQAISWYESAAQQKNTDALLNLAYIYQNGVGVKPSESRSLDYLRQAADAGSADAQFQLGMMYNQGEDNLAMDDDLARKWLRRAAEQGHVAAQFNYAMLLKAEPSEVYFWVSLAEPHLTANAKEVAKTVREKAAARLPASEKTAIDRKVEGWHPVPEEK